jgi:hypothetical protein
MTIHNDFLSFLCRTLVQRIACNCARNDSETLSLEFDAARAGAALACAYSNSAEFGAALIAARRAAGVYGSKRH